DGDGYGDPAGLPVSVCANALPPAGYVANATDCNDADPGIHPGAADANCNGPDDNRDGTIDNGAPRTGVATRLVQGTGGGVAQLAWGPIGAATGYDVVKGSLQGLESSGGNFTSATTACLGNNLPTTSVNDTQVPDAGQGFWYLIRAVYCSGSG